MTHFHMICLRGMAIMACAALGSSNAYSQGTQPEPLRLDGIVAAGVRNTVTESWSTVRVDLANTSSEGRQARVAVFYPERPDVQFTRDIFIPARTAVSSWLTVGPAPSQKYKHYREVEVLLYDRTDPQERLVRPPGGDAVRNRPLFYRPREPTTSVLLDDVDLSTESEAAAAGRTEAVTLVRTLREAAGLSEYVSVIPERFLPLEPEAFDGIDVLVLAGNRLAHDPVGRQAVRRWVQQGGSLWVLLDRVDAATLAPFLGDECDLSVIDRVRLETIRFHQAGESPVGPEERHLDLPVEMVRVELGERDTVIHQVNGWPASFVRPVGRGRVFFTTLAPRGWYQTRTPQDPPPRFEHFPDSPAPLNPLAELALQFHLQPDRTDAVEAPLNALREMAMQEIGYSIIGPWTALSIFGGFLLALLCLGVFVRRSRRPELIGWLGPVLAIIAAAVFVSMGELSRRAVPPTVGVAALVQAVPGSQEAALSGVVAVYHPHSGPVSLATDRGTVLNLDDRGLEGQTRRRVVTDFDSWHWEQLNLPAGIRTGTFRSTIPSGRLSGEAQFGPDGVTGHLNPGPFQGLTDSILITPSRQPLSVGFSADNFFFARGTDILPAGQYLTSSVLTDRQQRRQAVYRALLNTTLPKEWRDRSYLLAWAETSEAPVTLQEGERVVGNALVAVPLEFKRPAVGSQVAIPRSFIPYSRVIQGRARPAVLEGTAPSESELQFELPRSVLPLTVERVHFSAKVRSPGRRFTVVGMTDEGPITVFEAENPLDPIKIEITDPRLLKVQVGGVLRLTLRISEQLDKLGQNAPPPSTNRFPNEGGLPPNGRPARENANGGSLKTSQTPLNQPVDLAWKIEAVGIDVQGRTGATP